MDLKRLSPTPFSRGFLIPAIFQLLGILLLITSSGCTTSQSVDQSVDRHSISEATLLSAGTGTDAETGTADSWTGTTRACGKAPDSDHIPLDSSSVSGSACELQTAGPKAALNPSVNAPAAQTRHTPPYPVPTLRSARGLRVTNSRNVKRCPTGMLRYCDHRRNHCSCVSPDAATRAMQPLPGRF